MSLITCGLADTLVFAAVVPWGTTVVSVAFVQDTVVEEFEVEVSSLEFDTEVLRIEFDPSPIIIEGC